MQKSVGGGHATSHSSLATRHCLGRFIMSLVHKPEMTEENLAAHRANGSMSQGAVTPEGKARVAAANLPHGFYSQAQNGALAALGEDPQEYADLMNSLESNLAAGLEGEMEDSSLRQVWRLTQMLFKVRNGASPKKRC